MESFDMVGPHLLYTVQHLRLYAGIITMTCFSFITFYINIIKSAECNLYGRSSHFIFQEFVRFHRTVK